MTEHRSDGALRVADGQSNPDLPAVLKHARTPADELVVEVQVEFVFLWSTRLARFRLGKVRSDQDRCQVEPRGLPMRQRTIHIQHLSVADGFLEASETKLGEVLAHLLGDELEEVDDVLSLAGEAPPQFRVLRGDPDRAGVKVAGAHHDAALDNKRSGCEAELLRTEQGANDDVAAGLQLAIHLQHHPVSQAIEHERLLGLSQTKLPRCAGVLERTERACTCSAVMAGNQNHVGECLHYTGGDRTDT